MSGPICWVCLEQSTIESPLENTGCACCRDSASGGRVHLTCAIQAAIYEPTRWTHCPTCRQQWTGNFELLLSTARCDKLADRPVESKERCAALGNLSAALEATSEPEAILKAVQINRELLSIWRRTLGSNNLCTLMASINLAQSLESAKDNISALSLSLETLSALRAKLGTQQATHSDQYNQMLATTLGTVSRLYAKQGNHAAARLLLEESMGSLQLFDVINPTAVHAMGNLGVCLSNIGDFRQGLDLKQRAAQLAKHVLGTNHPQTQALGKLGCSGSKVSESQLQDARAIGRLVGLRRMELNGSLVFVKAYCHNKGRYKVIPHGDAHCNKTLGIKPDNIVLKSGSAVIVQRAANEAGDNLPLWSNRRALVMKFDGQRSEAAAHAGKGMYHLHCPEIDQPNVVASPGWCILDFAIEPKPLADISVSCTTKRPVLSQKYQDSTVPRDDLPNEEEAEVSAVDVVAMGCGPMIPLEDDY